MNGSSKLGRSFRAFDAIVRWVNEWITAPSGCRSGTGDAEPSPSRLAAFTTAAAVADRNCRRVGVMGSTRSQALEDGIPGGTIRSLEHPGRLVIADDRLPRRVPAELP